MNPLILHWSYRDFREFPKDLMEHQRDVEEVYLKENFIPTIPLWLFEFINLKFIQLSGNVLSVIPNEINLLENLEHLDISKNRLKTLPATLTKLNKLQYLNVSHNAITEINQDIYQMKSLETLNFCKNKLTELPIELARCTSLSELLVNDNEIVEIPTKIMSMSSLKVLEAERCSLEYLPGIIGPKISHIRVFNNTRLTHYPTIYERFLRLHYDYWSENVVSADLLMIFLPDESKRTILPRGMNTVHLDIHPRCPSSLVELGLRGLVQNSDYYNLACSVLPEGVLPSNLHRLVMHGAICLCGHPPCSKPIFTECHFSLLKKNKSPSHIIFSNMFCSKDCSSKWHSDNKKTYHPIEWTSLV